MSGVELIATDFAPPPAEGVDLSTDEVHVWRVDLAVTTEQLAACQRLLAEEELARADRFRFARHRRRHIVGWAAVRRLLGAYSNRQPGRLSFAYGRKGKPALEDDPTLEFNLTHSRDLALIAVGRGGAVGIDVECLKPLADADDIARRFFSRREVEAYLEQPQALRQRAFFTCWTRKEAFVKALGEGLFLSLDRFDVSLAPGEPARVLAIDGSAGEAAGWSLRSIEPAAGFVGALATPWRPRAVRALHLPRDPGEWNVEG